MRAVFGAAACTRLIAVLVAASLTTLAVPAEPAAAASSIGRSFFGTHDSNPIDAGWPKAPVGSYRAWDAGVTWRQLETSPGVWNWKRLDDIVRTAQANGSDVLLVLGQTPEFHATQPTAPSLYGPGASSMPKIAAWTNYVKLVGARYKNKPVKYQVWNEANIIQFWSGTPYQLANLTRVTDTALRSVDPDALLVAPALATRYRDQRLWIDKFYRQRPAVKGYDYPVARYVDVVSLHLYPVSTGAPETSMTLLTLCRAILRNRGVTKPIWNDEVNYGLTNGSPVKPLSDARQMAFVGRTYLLNAANGVRRVYWYSWEQLNWFNTRMTYSDDETLAPAGKAFAIVRGWMVGTRMEGCSRDAAGTYTCLITYTYGKRRVYWNPSRTVYVRTVSSATMRQNMNGYASKVGGGQRFSVGYSPVMIRSNR
jgi:hypothetical protein